MKFFSRLSFLLPLFASISFEKATAAIVVVNGGNGSTTNNPVLLSSYNVAFGANADLGNYVNSTSFFRALNSNAEFGTTYYQSGGAAFSTTVNAHGVNFRTPHGGAPPTPNNGAMFGQENWIAYRNGTQSGWLSFNLGNIVGNGGGTLTSINYFVYDNTPSSSPISLSQAINEVHPVPEFSNGAAAACLCLLGGLSHRRRHV